MFLPLKVERNALSWGVFWLFNQAEVPQNYQRHHKIIISLKKELNKFLTGEPNFEFAGNIYNRRIFI